MREDNERLVRRLAGETKGRDGEVGSGTGVAELAVVGGFSLAGLFQLFQPAGSSVAGSSVWI